MIDTQNAGFAHIPFRDGNDDDGPSSGLSYLAPWRRRQSSLCKLQEHQVVGMRVGRDFRW